VWLKAKLADMRRAKPQTSFVGWIAAERLADHIQWKLEDFARHADQPISAEAISQLQRALKMMLTDLKDTRPF
jgi:hypothetical protein